MGAAISVETAVSVLSPAKDQLKLVKIRSSRQEISCKEGVLKNFTKFTGKHLCQCFFFNNVAGLKKEALAQVFFREF